MSKSTAPSGLEIYTAGTYKEKLQECREDLYAIADYLSNLESLQSATHWASQSLDMANDAVHRARLHLGHTLEETDKSGQNPYKKQYNVFFIRKDVNIEIKDVDKPDSIEPLSYENDQILSMKIRVKIGHVIDRIITLHRSSIEHNRSHWAYMYLEEALKQCRLAQSHISEYMVAYEKAHT